MSFALITHEHFTIEEVKRWNVKRSKKKIRLKKKKHFIIEVS